MDDPHGTTNSQTRRTLLKGAGGTVVGLAGAGLLPTTAGAHDLSRPKPPFDIRDLVSGAEDDNEQIQCYYDTINRSVILAGDIPFQKLFGKPMSWLIPRIEAQVEEAAEFQLLDDPNRVSELLNRLLELAGGQSMTDFFTSHARNIDRGVLDTLIALRQQGVLAPLPTQRSGGRRARRRSVRRRRKAIMQVRRRLRKETIRTYLTRPKVDHSPKQRETVMLAKNVSLLSCGNNDRCCKTVKKTPGGSPLKQKCISTANKDCYIAVRAGPPLCTAASDDC